MKGKSVLIVGMLILSGIMVLTAILPANVSACNMGNTYVNGTRVQGPDGDNGDTTKTVNAPSSPNYVWEYGQSFWYEIRVTMTPGCGNCYICKLTVVRPAPDGWTLDILDNTVGIGKAEGSSIDGVMMGSTSTATDGFSGNVDYKAKFIVTPPATGVGSDITFKVVLETEDRACNDHDFTTIVWTGTIGPPNNLPAISLSKPTGGQTYANQVDIEWTATDIDSASPTDLTISLAHKKVGLTVWTQFANGLKNSGTTDKGTYTWDINSMDDGDYDIQATVTDKRNGQANAQTPSPITINNPDTPLIEITNPNAYVSFSNSLDIQWTATDNDEPAANLLITLLYTNDIASGIWYTIVSDTANDGSYVWDISKMPDGNNYMMKAVAKDTSGLTGQYITPNKFIINNANAPVVKINFPTEGASITGTKTIYWSAEDDEDADTALKIRIAYSLDNAKTWTNIVINEKNDGEYSWNTASYPDSENYIMNISTADSTSQIGFDVSKKFKVFNNDKPTVAFTNPVEAGTLAGTEANIQWTATDQETTSENLKITLEYKSAESGWETIEGAYDMLNTGSFLWDTTVLEDGAYQLRITVKDANGGSVQVWSGNFTIYNADEPSITLLAPKDGATLRGNAEIRWDAYDEDAEDVVKIDIFYSTTGTRADTWVPVASDLDNTGSYRWDTTKAPNGDVYIKVVAKDGVFEIPATSGKMKIDNSNNAAPVVTIQAPDTKDMVIKGTYKIKWTATDADGNTLKITIQYSTNKATWTDIENAVEIANSGEFNWDTKTMTDGQSYYIRVTAYDGKTSGEMSSKKFAIQNTVVTDDDVADDDDTDEPKTNYGTIAFITIPILLIIIIAVVLIIVFVMMRKKKKEEEAKKKALPPGAIVVTATPYGNRAIAMGPSQTQASTAQIPQNQVAGYLPPANSSGPQYR